MRMNELGLNEDDESINWGSMTPRDFKNTELKSELKHEDNTQSVKQHREELPRDYYKIPFSEKELANKNKLAFDTERKLWFKTWDRGIRVNIPELNKYRWSIYSAKFLNTPSTIHPTSSTKPVIAMTFLHYWPINDATATGAILADIPLRQDKNNKWYLPEYTVSGEKFQKNLSTMIGKFGNPKTVTIQKR